MFGTPISRLRIVGLYEGISFLVLLAIAMPLKYWMDIPQLVTVVGVLHGVLFILYMLALAHVTFKHRWSFGKVAGGFIAAFLPFGTFVFDSRVLRNAQ